MERFQNKNIIIWFLIVVVCVISVIWGVLVWNDTHISTLDTSKYVIYKAGSDGYEMGIDSATCNKDDVSITKDYIYIGGWVVNKNVPMERVTISVILEDTETKTAYVVPTTVEERTDVTEYFEAENLNWSGFNIKIPYGKIDTEKNNYRIAVLLRINGSDAVIVDSGKNTGDFKKNEN